MYIHRYDIPFEIFQLKSGLKNRILEIINMYEAVKKNYAKEEWKNVKIGEVHKQFKRTPVRKTRPAKMNVPRNREEKDPRRKVAKFPQKNST